MYAAVVKFDSLADAIGAAAQNDNLLFIGRDRFIFVVIGGVVIGRERFEFGRAGIHDLVGRPHPVGFSEASDFRLPFAGQQRQLPVGKSHALCPQKGMLGEGIALFVFSRDFVFKFGELMQVFKKPDVDSRSL